MSSKKRRRECHKKRKRLVERLVRMKVSHNLSCKQIQDIVQVCTKTEAPMVMKLLNQQLKSRKKSNCAYVLHGCATCEDYVWLESERQTCPNCKNLQGRYCIIPHLRSQEVYQ